ncbi:MAG: ferredoxin [Phaeodactylibacter sp.]|nr:ferredoxin [Phaeodactylibacter sp.]
MSNKDSDRETITGFFRDDALGIPGFLGDKETSGAVLSFEEAASLPRLPKASPAPEAEQKAYWRTLRAFFRTGMGGGLPIADGQLQAFPALLSPFRGKEYVQYNFPCWVADAESVAKGADAEASFFTLQRLLQRAVEKMAPQEGQAKILKDNLLRLEGAIRTKVRFADAAFKAVPVFEEALSELEAQLSVKGEEGKAFAEDLLRLKKALPQSGVLIPFSNHAPLHLLATVIQRQLLIKRQAVQSEIMHLANQLKDILAVEREKDPGAHSAEKLHSALDFADTFLNFEELSSVLPSGGSEVMPEERHHRIERVLDSLNKSEELLLGHNAFVVLNEEHPEFNEIDWKHNFPGFDICPAASGKLSLTASEVFDEQYGKAARVFAAIRIGQLEVKNQYVPEMHSDFFTHFDWRSFNEQELAACAPVLMLADAGAWLEEELNAFSRQLALGRPIKYMAIQGRQPAIATEDGQPSAGLAFRRELGALVIAHRNAFVLQSSAIRPEYLNEGFIRGISIFAPALFYLPSAQPGKEATVEPSLWASAAAEGREFPAFTFDSQKGPKWGSRFDIHENPQPEVDWPAHQLAMHNEKGEESALELRFTFADFAVLDGHFNNYFHIVPPEYWTESLIPMEEYLKLPDEEGYTQVPFIWLVDEHEQLQRAAVAWPLVLACQERLDFWHYLQENAGIHSYHVEVATETLSQELQQAAEKKIADLQAGHEAEVEKAKEESARNAMERLASMLLDLDMDTISPTSPGLVSFPAPAAKPQPEPAPEPTRQAAKETPPPQAAAIEEPEEEGLGEAWIETPLCTSCNECIDANKRIFQYNADKQAFVADPKGGAFADIVRAAEKCPVKIIHPGAPQNPKEEGLEEWVKRAAPLQG